MAAVTDQRIPLRSRLAIRQALPIALTLVCLLGTFPVVGYFFARDQILDGAERQAAQLAASISRYDG